MNIGDIIKIKSRFSDIGTYAIVLHIDQSEWNDDYGWVSFDYTVMTNKGTICRITEGCAESVYSLSEQ